MHASVPHGLPARPAVVRRGLRGLAAALRLGALGALLLWGPGPASGSGLEARSGDGPLELERFSLEDGLSQATVLAVLQDSRGWVWLGTEDGLNRFDGETFHVYRPDADNPSSLPAGFIRALDEDAAGNLWVGTEGGGVARWDPRTDRFVRYRNDRRSASPHLSSDYVQALAVDRAGRVWIGLRRGGLERLDPRSGELVRYRFGGTASSGGDRVTALAESADGSLWVGTRAGVERLDLATGRSTRPVEGTVRALFEDRSGSLWIGFENRGLARLDAASGALTRFRHDPSDPASLADDQVRALAEDGDGRLWVGTLAGLDRLERPAAATPGSGRFTHVGRDEHLDASLGAVGIVALHLDRDGALWIGTNLAGAARWDPRRPAFAHHRVSPPADGESPPDVVTSFAEDADGRLWIGTFGTGLARVDRRSGDIVRFRHDPTNAASLGDDRVMALLADRGGRLWIGTKTGGLNRLGAGGRFTRLRHDPANPASLGADGVMSLLEDSAGAIWVGTFGGGLSRLDPVSGAIVTFRHDPEDPHSLASDRVTALAEAGRGRLWVGTDGGGLHLLDPASRRATSYRHRPDDPASLPGDTVLALHLDAAGTLWIGTRGGGLSRLEAPDDGGEPPRFTTWSERHGLPNGVVYAIRPDAGGGLWMSTNHGLSRFDPRAGTFANFDVRHGLQANEFNFGAAYRSPSGELFFGGINGYNAFRPERLLRLAATDAEPRFDRHAAAGSDAPARPTARRD